MCEGGFLVFLFAVTSSNVSYFPLPDMTTTSLQKVLQADVILRRLNLSVPVATDISRA